MLIALLATAWTACGGCGGSGDASASSRRPRPKPAAVEASLDAASAYLQSGQTSNAEAILMQLVERAPAESRAHELLGQALVARAAEPASAGRADDLRSDALAHYLEACRLRPEEAGLAHAAGVVALAAERPDVALAHFERAAALDPSTPQYPLFAAQVLMRFGRREEAAQRLHAALDLQEDLPHAHASLALIEAEAGRADEALGHLRRAIALEPDDPALRVTEARVLRRLGRGETALERLLALPEADRADLVVATELASAARAAHRVDLAYDAWVTCYRAAGAAGEPAAGRRAAAEAGLAALDLERPDDARAWLDRARLLGPDDVLVRTLGRRLEG